MNILKKLLLLLTLFTIVACVPSKPTIDITKELQLAKSGNHIAQNRLGYAYDVGVGTPKDIKKAIMWYKKAAEQGNSDAQNNLGAIYNSGDGIPKDYKEAVKWYTKAAKQGNATAQNSLAIRYLLGEGVKKNVSKAIYWYEESAKNGNLWAMLNLGENYMDGSVVKKDLVKAYKWLEIARFYTTTSRNMNLKWSIRSRLNKLKETMPSSQIEEGKKLIGEWNEKRRVNTTN